MTSSIGEPRIIIRGLGIRYHRRQILKDIDLTVEEKSITSIVGPSGCGKSTLLMVMNRLLDTVPHAHVEGEVRIRFDREGWRDVLKFREPELPDLRRRVGLVFQHPNVLPKSIFRNVAFPLKLRGVTGEEAGERVRRVLEEVHLWDEVKDRLHGPAVELSGGQQQRLCLARVLIMEPEVLLLDEPTSFLDEKAAVGIETLLRDLKRERTVLVVSHYLDQVKRLSDTIHRLKY
jgi:phosphate transport system ATP-binding protein